MQTSSGDPTPNDADTREYFCGLIGIDIGDFPFFQVLYGKSDS